MSDPAQTLVFIDIEHFLHAVIDRVGKEGSGGFARLDVHGGADNGIFG